MSLDTGSLVSHYRIVRRLGAGGMGEVFLAQDLWLDRQVAIKFLKGPGDERAHKRLVQEARAAASLDHPYICAVYEVGSDSAEGDFIVMQFVEGEPLSSRLARQRLPPAEAIALCKKIAEALKAAHVQGIIHRDLKPHNVIVTPAGEPKLLDFGIAKRILNPQAAAEADTTSQVTNPDGQVGTPAYMSPEQVRSHPADFRSDLFALGCVLYECLTGRRAFNGPTTPDVLGQVLHVEPPPPSAIVPELGTMYDPICAKLLKKDPRERFQSADEVLGALYALTMAASPTEITATAKRTAALTVPVPVTRTGKILAAAGLVVLIGGAFAVYRWSRPSPLADPPERAKTWYRVGVGALRQGTFVAARTALEQAIAVFPQYIEAHSRLAEAYSELDDEKAAGLELVEVSSLAPDQSRLPRATQLRLEGIREAVLHHYDKSVVAYRQLATLDKTDAGAWVDIGRAEEGRDNTLAAREAYRTAILQNLDEAVAHLRLGASPGLPIDEATREFDEAIRLYGNLSNPEGEAEAQICKGIALNSVGKTAAARQALERAISITTDDKYHSQQLRARLELASVTRAEGHFDVAATQARAAVDDATRERFYTVAAKGLIDLGTALAFAGHYDEADAALVNAIGLASDHGAKRTEMRARLQQVSIKANLPPKLRQPALVVTLTTDLLPFFADGRYPRNEAEARTILARAYAQLGQYDEADRQAHAVLRIGEDRSDDRQRAAALVLIHEQLSSLGRMPEALTFLQQAEDLHRKLKNPIDISFDLTSRAELLIELGRGSEVEKLFTEIAEGAKQKIQTYIERAPRVTTLRALQASIEGRFGDVVRYADQTIGTEAGPTAATLLAFLLREHALAITGRRGKPSQEIIDWLQQARSSMSRAGYSYWIGLTLLARHDAVRAAEILREAWADPIVAKNLELHWRIGSVLMRAQRAQPGAVLDPGIAAKVETERATLAVQYGADAQKYSARPDLKDLIARAITSGL